MQGAGKRWGAKGPPGQRTAPQVRNAGGRLHPATFSPCSFSLSHTLEGPHGARFVDSEFRGEPSDGSRVSAESLLRREGAAGERALVWGIGVGGDRALGPPPSTPPRGTGRGGRGERCWRPGRSRVAGGRRGWRAAAEEGAHPDKPRSPDFWPSPGRWGALAGALRGSPPLSGGFFLFKQSPPLRTVDLDPPLSCLSKQPRA